MPEKMPAHNVTVVAHWTEVVTEVESEYVEIVFGKKDMTRKDIENIVKSLTEEKFEIIEFGEDEGTGEVKVIIKFNDPESSKDFVRNANNYSRDNPNIIKRVKAVDIKDSSYAEQNTSCFWFTLLIAVIADVSASLSKTTNKKQAHTKLTHA